MSKNYYGINKNKNANNVYYTPGTLGKITMAFTIPAIVIAIVSVLIALFAYPQLIGGALLAFVVSFVGSIVLVIDILLFNRRQKQKSDKREGTKDLDIGRMVHLALGVVVGIIIGYLIWGK